VISSHRSRVTAPSHTRNPLVFETIVYRSGMLESYFHSSRVQPNRMARLLCGRSHKRGHVRVRANPNKDDDKKESKVSLNPVELGRRSRQALDDAWSQITSLTGSRASFTLDDDLGADVSTDEFQMPQARLTSVLVVGGTGKLGRIVVRKLLLRGYRVRVMCRDTNGMAESTLPSGVSIVRGNVGNLRDCLKAVDGMDKVRASAATG
jgi:hypothetical protein